MKLTKLTDHIWVTDTEERRDRPVLGYILAGDLPIAVDAGHSPVHAQEFYGLLDAEHLPLPELTVVTHWHWDHTFAMHAVQGRTVAEERIEEKLQAIRRDWTEESEDKFKAMDPHVQAEYEDRPIVVAGADMVFRDRLTFRSGNMEVQCFHAPSPHTDDAVLVYVPQERVLFFGDAMCGVYPEWTVDPAVMAQFVEVLEGLDFDLAVGGHWEPFQKAELMEDLRKQM